MKKRAHKVLGIELRASNIVRATDPRGQVAREELDWSGLSAPQQALIEGHAKRRLGQDSPG